MTILCPTSIRGEMLRITRNDPCGAPLPSHTPNSRHVTEGFSLFQFSPDIDPGTEVLRKNAKGLICMRNPGTPQLKGFNVEVRFCGINPVAAEMFGAIVPLLDGGTDVVGWAWKKDIDPRLSVQIEVWGDNEDDATCAGGGYQYIQWMFPKIRNWQLSQPISIQDDAVDLVMTGYMEPTEAFLPSDLDEWDSDDIQVIAEQGIFAWKLTNTLPEPTECAYVVAGS